VEGLEFETVPAYNLLKPFHPKGAEWVGYVLRIDGKPTDGEVFAQHVKAPTVVELKLKF
jgi:hypothetical protein